MDCFHKILTGLNYGLPYVHEANLSKIGTRGSQTEPVLVTRQWTEQFEAAFSNCSHCHGRGVGRCIVLMKQHTVTQLSTSYLLDSRPKFPDQFSVVTVFPVSR